MLNIHHLLKPSDPLIKPIQPAASHQGVSVLCEVVTDVTWRREFKKKKVHFKPSESVVLGSVCTFGFVRLLIVLNQNHGAVMEE